MDKSRKIIMVTTVLVLLMSLLAACGAKATPAPDTESSSQAVKSGWSRRGCQPDRQCYHRRPGLCR